MDMGEICAVPATTPPGCQRCPSHARAEELRFEIPVCQQCHVSLGGYCRRCCTRFRLTFSRYDHTRAAFISVRVFAHIILSLSEGCYTVLVRRLLRQFDEASASRLLNQAPAVLQQMPSAT